MSARACVCRQPPCFSRQLGSILGLYTAQPLPHRSGPSKLPGHVSLRRFEPEKLRGHVSFASRLWPATASLPHSSLPSCLGICLKGFETATWHVLARLKSLKTPKTSNSVKLARLSQHEPASVDGRPASAANWGEFGSIYGTALASPHRSGPSKLPGHVSLKRFETAKLPGHVSFCLTGLLRPPCFTPAFQAAWSCIFKGFRNCYVARFSQA